MGKNGTSQKRRRGRPKATEIFVQSREQISAMRIRFQLPDTVLTYRDVADALTRKTGTRVGLGTVYRLARGVEPHGSRLRKALGLPLTAPAPVCPVHGVVHARQCRQVPAWLEQAVDWLAARERVMRRG